MNKENIAYIKAQLSPEVLLCQLAEEASELAQAALKLCRVLDGSNPTPKTMEEALDGLHEELSDVALVLETLELTPCGAEHEQRMEEKLQRWVTRIQARKKSLAEKAARINQYLSTSDNVTVINPEEDYAPMEPGAYYGKSGWPCGNKNESGA